MRAQCTATDGMGDCCDQQLSTFIAHYNFGQQADA